MKFKFTGSTPVKENVVSFLFEPDQPLNWQPGQYFHYVFPHDNADDRGTERWFTNAAAPYESKIMISTRIESERGSSFKKSLQALAPGDEIEAEGPKGRFTIEDFNRNYIFIAGGIGITPFRSIILEAARQRKPLSVLLLYANRTNDVPFREELEQAVADNPKARIEYIIQPDRLDKDRLKKAIDSVENPFVYISGPEPMVESMAEEVKTLGVTEDNLKTDDFPGYEAD